MGPTLILECLYVSVYEVLAHNTEDTGSDPRVGGTFLFEKSPANPSVKRVPAWSCTGEQSTLAVSH